MVALEYVGYLAHKKLQPPKDHHRALGIGQLKVPSRKQFIMSEVPLYCAGNVINSHTKPVREVQLCPNKPVLIIPSFEEGSPAQINRPFTSNRID